MANINLAVIPKDWDPYNGVTVSYDGGPQICFVDNVVIRTTGMPSIRLEPHKSVNKCADPSLCLDRNHAREVDGRWLSCKPCDHIVTKIWIKTDGGTQAEIANDWLGGRIGVDVITNYPASGYHIVPGGHPTNDEYGDASAGRHIVPFNTPTWKQLIWDFYISDIYHNVDVIGNPINPPAQINTFVIWVQVMQNNDGTAKGNAWFTDAELYINPSTSPKNFVFDHWLVNGVIRTGNPLSLQVP